MTVLKDSNHHQTGACVCHYMHHTTDVGVSTSTMPALPLMFLHPKILARVPKILGGHLQIDTTSDFIYANEIQKFGDEFSQNFYGG